MKLVLTFKVDLASDYHLSAGGGKGSELDSALLRDSDGVPTLRGTTITGLLRDSMWQLLQLTPLEKYRETALNHIFGTPINPKHWQITSARPIDLLLPVSSYHESDTQVVQRVRVNPRTRRAGSRQLFSQENGDSRFVFSFQAIAVGEPEQILNEAAILVAVARHLLNLGRSQRRGQGYCRVSLISVEVDGLPKPDISQETLLTRFETHWLSGAVKLTNYEQEFPSQLSISPTETSLHTLRFRLIIRTDEPILLANRSESGNQYDSLEIVSGTALRGVFATQIAERNDLSQINNYENFVQLFWRGQVHFPPLYPMRRKNRDLFSAIPIPFDIATCKVFSGLKTHQHGTVALAIESHSYCPRCQTELKSLSGFITVENTREEITLHKCNEMHIRLDPTTQRVRSGDLFDYMALGVGQYFIGELSFVDETAWQIFQKMLGLQEIGQTFDLQLGKAIRRGYGKVKATLIPCDNTEHVWIRLPFIQRVTVTSPQILVLTLLTDTIITDDWGRYLTSFEFNWLQTHLKIPIERYEVFTKPHLIDNFNTYIGLPRQRDVAISAGTSIGLHLRETLTQEHLQHLRHLESEGIGLRRNEGFGQVVFNHPIYHNKYQLIQGKVVYLDNPDMRLDEVSNNHFSTKVRIFEEKWQDVLKIMEKIAWKDYPLDDLEKLIDVAKWLQTNANQPLGTLQKQLERWKKDGFEPPENLTTKIKDYSPRQPKILKRTEALEKILGLISELQKLLQKYPSINQAVGLQLLADRIAAEAKLAREEKNQ